MSHLFSKKEREPGVLAKALRSSRKHYCPCKSHSFSVHLAGQQVEWATSYDVRANSTRNQQPQGGESVAVAPGLRVR